jgi:hypothetical protein
MPDPAAFRLTPNYLRTGQVAVVRVEWAPEAMLDKPCTVELVEVDLDGGQGDLIATFSATIVGADGQFSFSGVSRQSVPADDPADADLPGPEADSSEDGAWTYPREITWRRAHLKVQLDGGGGEHLVILRSAEGRDPNKREGMRYELGLRIKDSGGAVVFDSEDQFSSVTCWDALIGNCVDAVQNIYEGHHGMCADRDEGGDYYGSASGSSKSGGIKTDCVTFVLQVLDRAYGECRAGADARFLRQNAAYGSKFAPALADAGWALVLFVRDRELRLEAKDYYAGIYKKARDQGTLWGRPVEVVEDYNVDGEWDAVTDQWTEGQSDALMLERWNTIGEQVPFGIIGLGLRSHVVMKVGPAIYECHWSYGAQGANLFDRSETWENLIHEGLFWMAAPGYALREVIPLLEPIRPKLLPIELPPLAEPQPISTGVVPLPPTRQRRRWRQR